MTEAHQVQALCHTGIPFLGPHLAQAEAIRNVVGNGHVREERVRLEDHTEVALLRGQFRRVDAVDTDLTGGRFEVAGEHPEAGRFAAAAGAEQGGEFALFDLQVDVVDRNRGAVDLADAHKLGGDGAEGGAGGCGSVGGGAHLLMPPKILAKPTVRSAMIAITTVPAMMSVDMAAIMGSYDCCT